jgi:protein required for attachment to host cells
MSETWIVVADRLTARIFDPDGPRGRWNLIQEFIHQAARERNQKLRGNRPDQIQSTEERTYRGSLEPNSLQKIEEGKFAREICEFLERAYMANQFRELVLVSPPSMLGSMRHHLPRWLHGKVIRELDKDYGHLKPHELADTVAM